MASEVKGAGRRRLRVSLAVSLAVHVLTAVGISYWQVPMLVNPVRRGEPMMVELQGPDALAPAGNPALREPPGVPKAPAPPARSQRAERSRPAVRRPAPAPKAAGPPTPAPKAAAPPAATPPKTAAVPAAPPAPKAVVPPAAPASKAAAPAPPPEQAAPQPPRVASAPPPPVLDARPPEPSAPSDRPADRAPEPARAATGNEPAGRSSPATPGGAEGPRVASVPPGDAGSGRGAPPDIRSALRARPGGGGGRGGGWGGIEGEPVPLDSADPKFNDYLDRVRRLIKANWGYPCVKNASTRECEYKSATLVVAFGILKNGQLQIVEVRRSSGLPIYDDYAVNAIKLASPFPEVPSTMMTAGSAGLPIMATFNYISETSLVNLLR